MKRVLLSLAALSLVASHFFAESGPSGTLPADLDGDSAVTFDDFFLLVDQFGQSCAVDCSQLTADFNADKSVTFDDFFLFVDQFGQTIEPLLQPLADQMVPLGSSLTLQLEPTDPQRTDLRYVVMPLPLPEGAQFDAAMGRFIFTPTLDQAGQSFALLFGATAGEFNDCIGVNLSVSEQSGVTALSGRVLDTQAFVEDGSEVPVVGATVALLGTAFAVQTDAEGRFSFTDIPADSLIIDIDPSGAQAGPDGAVYAGFREQITVIEGVMNAVTRPFYLPRISAESLTVIDPNSTTRVENTVLGITVEVNANSARDENGDLFTGQLSISLVPDNLAPAVLPEGLEFSQLITIQPVGISFDPPAQISFPNLERLPGGSEVDIWSLDPETGSFMVVGTGRVESASRITTIGGGVRRANWIGALSPGTRVDSTGNNDNQDKKKCTNCDTGSETTVANGNLIVDHSLVSYRSLEQEQVLRLVYNSRRADPRPIVSGGATVQRRSAVPELVSAQLRVGGADQGPASFTDASGLSAGSGETIRQAVLFDARELVTGLYPYRLKLTSHYPLSAVSSFLNGDVLVYNQADSPFGAGWGLEGLQRLYPQSGGRMMLVEGDGSAQVWRRDPGVAAGLVMQLFDFPGRTTSSAEMEAAITGGVAGLEPDLFRVFSQSGVETVNQYLVPVIDFPRSEFEQDTFYNAGPNGAIDAGSDVETPQGDDISIEPPWVHGLELWRQNVFVAVFSGFLFVPEAGEVTFSVIVADLFHLSVDNQLLMESTQTGQPLRTFTGTVDLPAGYVPITLRYGEIALGAHIILGAEGGGLPGGVIPAEFFSDRIPIEPDPAVVRRFAAPRGEFSTLVEANEGGFVRRMKDGTQIRFDVEGRHIATEDRNGNTTTFQYNSEDQLVRVTDPVDLETVLSYNGDRLASVTDPADRTTTFEHDGAGDLVQIIDPDGTSRHFAYNERHLLTKQISKRGFGTTYEYNFAGHNVRVNRPDGSDVEIEPGELRGLVDPDGGEGTRENPMEPVRPEEVMSHYIDANGHSTYFVTDRFSASTRIIDPLEHQTTINRNRNGDPISVVQPDGVTALYTYDQAGNILATDEALGEAEEISSSFEYESQFSQVSNYTNAANESNQIEYDDGGNPVRIIGPLGGSRALEYDERGLTLKETDENNRTIAYTYDSRGNMLSLVDGDGHVIRTERDAAGNITTMIEGEGSPAEQSTTFTYDALNRIVSTVDPNGAETKVQYNAAGHVAAVERPTGQKFSLEYDELNRVSQTIDPDRGISTLSYDANGNIVQIQDTQGNTNTFQYDATDKMILSTDPLGGEVSLEYDQRGDIATIGDEEGRQKIFEYDALGRLVSRTNALGEKVTITYDSRDNIVRLEDGKGQVIERTFDSLSRLVKTVTPDNTIEWTYDESGNVLSVKDNDSHLAFTYSADEEIIQVQTIDLGHQPSVTTDYVYDAAGDLRQLTDSEGGTTIFARDPSGRLTRLTVPGGEVIDLEYNDLGQLVRAIFPNGIVSDYSYQADSGRLQRLSHTDENSTSLAEYSYLYDALGNLSSIEEGSQDLEVFSYDALERLLGGGSDTAPEAYSYSAAGNRLSSHLSSVYLYDLANRLLEDDDFVYTYDANGNRISKTAKSDGARTEYSYDAQNQLTGLVLPDATLANYRYDGLGRRIEKDVNGTITRYVYDGGNIMLEYNGKGELLTRFSHGDRIDHVLSLQRGDDDYYYHADHLGSIRLVTDTEGKIVNRYTYDSYGRSMNSTEGISNLFSYTGRVRDAESSLYYYRFRYYDPRIGSFISEDLVSHRLRLNSYMYASANPLNRTDPLGLLDGGDVSDILSVAGIIFTVISTTAEGAAYLGANATPVGLGISALALSFSLTNRFIAGINAGLVLSPAARKAHLFQVKQRLKERIKRSQREVTRLEFKLELAKKKCPSKIPSLRVELEKKLRLIIEDKTLIKLYKDPKLIRKLRLQRGLLHEE